MNRRKFLGAAAALASLPANGAAGGPENDQETAPDSAVIPQSERENLWASFYPREFRAGETASMRIRSEWLDDEPSAVLVSISDDWGELTLAYSPDEARQMAEDLTAAAATAEDGPGESP